MSEKRYLILAEGHSDDPHHGKTARGVIRYRREAVVAVVAGYGPSGVVPNDVTPIAKVADLLK